MEQSSLRKFVSEPTMSLMDVSTGPSTGVGDLGGYRENNPMSVAAMPVYETGERTEKDKIAAIQELERRGVAGAPVPSEQSVMAAPRSRNPFNPAFRETLRSALNDFMGASNIASAEPRSYARSKLADFMTGGADFVPVVGDAIGAAETEQQFRAGNYGTAGLYGAATLIGATGLGKPIAKGIKNVADNLPPLSNSQKTQLGSSTEPSYLKAQKVLGEGKTLDFGAGRGQGASKIGADTLEPFPREGFSPTFTNALDIPSESYENITSLNVLNVMPREARDQAVADIGRILSPGGKAVVTTRGRDVMNAKGRQGPEPLSIITSADTYQKGFTQPELRDYMQLQLGEGFTVSNLPEKIGQAGVLIEKTGGAAKATFPAETNQSALRRFSGPEIQTAQAGRVVETPIMDVLNEKGYSINPFMAQTDLNVRPENIAVGNYRGLVERYKNDPDYAMREQARLLGGRYTEPEDLFMPSGTYEDLIGNPLVILPADRTIRGVVDRIAGIDLDNPLMVEGGPGHADAWKNWMSSRGAAVTKQAHINRVREATGKDPILIYSANLDEGSNYSVSPSFAAVEMISSTGGLNKNQTELLDRAIKKLPDSGETRGIAESWSGYESPEQLIDWLFTESPRASAGNKRKAFMGQVLAKKALTDAGFPIPKDIYSVVNEPSMRGMPKGFSGYRGMVTTDIAPQDLITDTTLNKSYDTIIPAQEAFALGGQMVPVEIMFKDPMQARLDMGKDFNEAYRSLMTSGGKKDYQMATEEWFDRLNQYLESTKKAR
tara:strand:- start:2082 stop:4409 length:2328 start_codon:yes stop_codon:yes gene_type:complete